MNKLKIKKYLYYFILTIGVIIGTYVAGWLMIVKPILLCCAAYSSGLLTGYMISITILKFIFSFSVFLLIIYLSLSIYSLIYLNNLVRNPISFS